MKKYRRVSLVTLKSDANFEEKLTIKMIIYQDEISRWPGTFAYLFKLFYFSSAWFVIFLNVMDLNFVNNIDQIVWYYVYCLSLVTMVIWH